MFYEHKENTGSIFKNDKKKEGDNQPGYTGIINCEGKIKRIALWVQESKEKKTKFFSAKISDLQQTNNTPEAQEEAAEDDLPF